MTLPVLRSADEQFRLELPRELHARVVWVLQERFTEAAAVESEPWAGLAEAAIRLSRPGSALGERRGGRST